LSGLLLGEMVLERLELMENTAGNLVMEFFIGELMELPGVMDLKQTPILVLNHCHVN